MKQYDYPRAMAYLSSDANVDSACMGMYEDWEPTQEDVYSDGRWTSRAKNIGDEIGGIGGSCWATPALEVTFKDGNKRMFSCYSGDADVSTETGIRDALSNPMFNLFNGMLGYDGVDGSDLPIEPLPEAPNAAT